MSHLPTIPGPHKINVDKFGQELFEIEKEVMAVSPYLYQFNSFEEFITCFTADHTCTLYIWNDEKGNIIGFFAHEKFKDTASDELMIIVVRPKFQGQGYGKKMMEFYFNLLKKGEKSILSTHEKNYGAIHFYGSLGYKMVKKLPNQYNDGQTRILFEKN